MLLRGVFVFAETLDYHTPIHGHQHLALVLVEATIEGCYGSSLLVGHLALGLAGLLVDDFLERLLCFFLLLASFFQLLGDRKKRYRMFKRRSSVAQSLPEGVCDTPRRKKQLKTNFIFSL